MFQLRERTHLAEVAFPTHRRRRAADVRPIGGTSEHHGIAETLLQCDYVRDHHSNREFSPVLFLLYICVTT